MMQLTILYGFDRTNPLDIELIRQEFTHTVRAFYCTFYSFFSHVKTCCFLNLKSPKPEVCLSLCVSDVHRRRRMMTLPVASSVNIHVRCYKFFVHNKTSSVGLMLRTADPLNTTDVKVG